LDTIAAVIIGGASFLGGRGHIGHALVGAVMIGVIRRLTALLGGIAVAAAIAGPAPADQPIKLGFITKFPVPFFATMENAAKAYAAAHPGVEIIYGQGASATDIEGQIALIESMVTKGVQGIAITPVDPTVATTLDKAVAKGVKVVLMDNKIPNWKGQTALATTNNLEAGKIAGAYLKSVLKDGDTIGILEGVPGVPALDDRVNGMLEGLKGVNVKIVGKGETDCQEEKGINVAQDMLTANPHLVSVYSASRRTTYPSHFPLSLPPARSTHPRAAIENQGKLLRFSGLPLRQPMFWAYGGAMEEASPYAAITRPQRAQPRAAGVPKRSRARTLTTVDKRSILWRRICELKALFTTALAGAGLPSPIRQLKIEQAASALATAELMRGRFLRDGGGDKSFDEVLRAERRKDAAVKRLGLPADRPQPPVADAYAALRAHLDAP